MAWTNIASRIPNTDNNAAADVNALMADLLLIKGGTAGTTPSTTLEAEAPKVTSLQGSVDTTINAATNSAQTLTYASLNQDYSPSGDHDVNLPKTSVVAGWKRRIFNRSATKLLTLKATNSTPGDGGTLVVLTPLTWIDIQAKVATPSANTDWMQVDAQGSWFTADTDAADFSAGWGSVTAITTYAKRNGANMQWLLKFKSGTAAANECNFAIPFGLSVKAAVVNTLNKLGEGIRFPAGGGAAGADDRFAAHYNAGSGATVLRVCYRVSGDAGITWNADTGADMFGNDENHSYVIELPILGWELG